MIDIVIGCIINIVIKYDDNINLFITNVYYKPASFFGELFLDVLDFGFIVQPLWCADNACFDFPIYELQKLHWKVLFLGCVDGTETLKNFSKDGNEISSIDFVIFLWKSLHKLIAHSFCLITFRYSSLNSLVCIPRRSTEINGATSYSLSSRVNPNFDNYQWRVGGSVIPNKPIQLINSNTTGGFAEAYIELLRSWHSVSSSDCAGSLPFDYFNVANTAIVNAGVIAPNTTSTSYKNGFVIAQELQVFSNRNSLLLSGINTLGQNIYFDAAISTSVGADFTLNFFANFDILYILDRQTGVLQVKF